MPVYSWKGINQQGNPVKGSSPATTPDHLREQLLAQQIALLGYTAKKQNGAWVQYRLVRPVSTKQLCEFFDRLSLLLASGVELVRALEVVQRLTTHQTLANCTHQLTQTIAQGQSFSSALQAYPYLFSPFIVQVVHVGEKTGKLDIVLESLKNNLVQQMQLRQNLKRATLAPLITLGVAFLLISGILFFILPHFQSLYQSLGSTLPPATQRLLYFHSIISSSYGFVLLGAVVAVIALIKIMLKQSLIKHYAQALTLKIPILNRIIIDSNLIIFIQTVSLYLSSGLPLTQALDEIKNATQNLIFRREIAKVAVAILEGSCLYDAIKSCDSQFFDEQFLALIQVGEQSGKLGIVLNNACARYQNMLAERLQSIITIFSPLLMIIIGLIIGWIMVLMYLPIFSLGNLFGQ